MCECNESLIIVSGGNAGSGGKKESGSNAGGGGRKESGGKAVGGNAASKGGSNSSASSAGPKSDGSAHLGESTAARSGGSNTASNSGSNSSASSAGPKSDGSAHLGESTAARSGGASGTATGAASSNSRQSANSEATGNLRTESNFARTAKATQETINQLDGNIAATKGRISKLVPQTDTSKTDQQIEQNLELAKRANADNAKKVMEHQLNHQQPTNPISEIVDAAKTAKDVKDTGNLMIETLDYDRPGYDVIENMDKLEQERSTLQKMERSKQELEHIRDAALGADKKLQQQKENPATPLP